MSYQTIATTESAFKMGNPSLKREIVFYFVNENLINVVSRGNSMCKYRKPTPEIITLLLLYISVPFTFPFLHPVLGQTKTDQSRRSTSQTPLQSSIVATDAFPIALGSWGQAAEQICSSQHLQSPSVQGHGSTRVLGDYESWPRKFSGDSKMLLCIARVI